jgi:hypothetical protein
MRRAALRLAEVWIPAFLKKRALADLAALTAEAFGCAPPELARLAWPAQLEAYARFTASEARTALLRPAGLPALRARLREGARGFGSAMARRFGAAGLERGMRVARVLYGAIGIDFAGGSGGEIVVRACGFSRHYDGPVCGLVSALDEGVLAGLLGGGRLEFRERLTEGGAACRAVFRPEEPRT